MEGGWGSVLSLVAIFGSGMARRWGLLGRRARVVRMVVERAGIEWWVSGRVRMKADVVAMVGSRYSV